MAAADDAYLFRDVFPAYTTRDWPPIWGSLGAAWGRQTSQLNHHGHNTDATNSMRFFYINSDSQVRVLTDDINARKFEILCFIGGCIQDFGGHWGLQTVQTHRFNQVFAKIRIFRRGN